MTFQHLLDGAEVLAQSGNPDVSSVEYDSRRVKSGDAFIASAASLMVRVRLNRGGMRARLRVRTMTVKT